MPRQEWIDGKFIRHDDHEESWVDLFIDLVYVLLLSSLAHTLSTCEMSVTVYFRTSLLFWITCLTRQAMDEYTNRFFCHDVVQKANFLLYSIGLCVQVYSFCILAWSNHELTHEHCDITSPHFSSSYAVGVLVTRICLLNCKLNLFMNQNFVLFLASFLILIYSMPFFSNSLCPCSLPSPNS